MEQVIAIAVCWLFVFLFVGLLYVRAAGRKDRDSQEAIVARFQSVAVACIASGAVTFFLIPGRSWSGFLLYTGLQPVGAVRMLAPLFMTMLLFFGPLVQSILEEPEEWQNMGQMLWLNVRHSLIWWRNYVVAPVAEEWVFRGCMVPVLHLAGFTASAMMLLPPLFFGLAHSHHVVTVLRERGASPAQAAAGVLFQVGYTSLFGAMAAYYLINTGSLVGPVLAHAFCNTMGFPPLAHLWTSSRRVLLGSCYLLGLVGYAGCCWLLHMHFSTVYY